MSVPFETESVQEKDVDVNKIMRKLNITQKQKQALEDYTDLYCECSSILQETAFIYGMKLGIKILLDTLANNK